MDQLIYDFMQEEKIPGMTLAIVQAPYIPRVVGYGLSNAETGLLSSTNTLWPAAEISQGYAAIAAFQLVEKGKMDIHDKVSRYVAGCRKPGRMSPCSSFFSIPPAFRTTGNPPSSI